jgi:hypothetical protein
LSTPLPLQPAFELFSDRFGRPLESGYIYIGTEGQNPQTNPIQVYYNEALSVPAAQPIRTSYGYPTNGGSLARVFVGASRYSITVRDKAGALVFSTLSASNSFLGISQAEFDALLPTSVAFKRTAEEIAAGNTPENFNFLPGDRRRYTVDEFDFPQLINRDSAGFDKHSFAGLPRLTSFLEQQVHGSRAPIRVIAIGSSVGNLLLTNGLTIGQHFFNELVDIIDPTGERNFTFTNACVNGQTWSQANAQLAAGEITAGGTAKLVITIMGMNDQGPPIFNEGQTYPMVRPLATGFIVNVHNNGGDVIVMGTNHLDTDNAAYNLQGILNQSYPTFIAAPVNPEAMTPPASLSVLTGDYLGIGVDIDIDARAFDVNHAQHIAAIDTGACYLDVQTYDFLCIARYGVTNPNLAISRYGSPSQIVHLAPFGLDQAYGLAINTFCRSIRRCGGSEANGKTPFKRQAFNIEGEALSTVHIQQEAAGVNLMEMYNTAGTLVGRFGSGGTFVMQLPGGSRAFTLNPNAFSGTRYLLDLFAEFVKFKAFPEGRLNVSGNQDFLLEAESSGIAIIKAVQSGIGRQTHIARVTVSNTTVSTATISDNGVVVVTMSGSGLNLRAACAAGNTEIQLIFLMMGGS